MSDSLVAFEGIMTAIQGKAKKATTKKAEAANEVAVGHGNIMCLGHSNHELHLVDSFIFSV